MKKAKKFDVEVASPIPTYHATWLTLCNEGEVLKRGVFVITLLMAGIY